MARDQIRRSRVRGGVRQRLARAALEALEPRIVLDGEVHVVSSTFGVDPRPTLNYQFDNYTYSPTGPYVVNLFSGAQVQTSGGGWTDSHAYTFDGALPTGRYEAVLRRESTVTDPIDADHSTSFFFVQGDANHDGVVGPADYAAWQESYDRSHPPEGAEPDYGPFSYPQGDFNLDGVVDETDQAIIAGQSWGTYLSESPAGPNTLEISSAGPERNALYLEWNPPAAEMGAYDGYHIYRSSDGGVHYALCATVEAGITRYTDDDLPDGAKYYYRVRAFKEGIGNSVTTNEVWAATHLPAPDSLVIERVGDSSVSLRWHNNSAQGSVEVWAKRWGEDEFQLVGGGSSAATVDGLSPGTAYLFQIRAVTAGQTSAPVTADGFVSTLPEGVPGGLTALASGNTLQIDLNWLPTSAAIDGYRVYRSGDEGASFTQVGDDITDAAWTSFTDTLNLVPGHRYYYHVVCLTGSSESMASNEAFAVAELPAPQNVSATLLTPQSISISWVDNSSIATGWEVLHWNESSADVDVIPFTLPSDVNPNGLGQTYAKTISGLTAGVIHKFAVRAVLGNTRSPNSQTIDGRTGNVAIDLDVDASQPGQVVLSWAKAGPAFNGYHIYRKTDGDFTLVKTLPSASVSGWTDTSVEEGVHYTYRIRAYLAGQPDFSPGDEVTVVTKIPSPDNLHVTDITSSTVKLHWRDNSQSEDHFEIWAQDLDGGQEVLRFNVAGSAGVGGDVSAVVNASELLTYRFFVRAASDDGGHSDASPGLTLNTGLRTPENLSVEALHSDRVRLSWEDKSTSETNYEIWMSADNGAFTKTTIAPHSTTGITSHEVGQLLPEHKYRFYVRAVTAHQQSDPSATVAIKMPRIGAVATPTGVSTSRDQWNQVHVTWNDVSSNEGGFIVARRETGGRWYTIGTTAANTGEFIDKTASPAATYEYTVYAKGQQGSANSAPSDSGPADSSKSTGDLSKYYSDAYSTNGGSEDPRGDWSTEILDENGSPKIFHDESVSLTINNIPKHNFIFVGFSFKLAGAPASGEHFTVELSGSVSGEPAVVGYSDPPSLEINGHGEGPHKGSTATFSFEASGFGQSGWYFGSVGVAISVPIVGVAGGGEVTEGETESNAGFTFTREIGWGGEPTNVSVGQPTGSAGGDYSPIPSTVAIPADPDFSRLIAVTPIDDNIWEGDEQASVYIRESDDYIIDPAHQSASITIHDDDGPPGGPPNPSPGGPPGDPSSGGEDPNDDPGDDDGGSPPGGDEPDPNDSTPRDVDGGDNPNTPLPPLPPDPPPPDDETDNTPLDEGDPHAKDSPLPDSDQVAVASASQRVDIHGVPLPDPSPTGDGESDRVPNTASIDAFSLTPTFSTSDIAAPMPGGELTLEFRRTMHVDSRVLYPIDQAAQNFHWASESVMGMGWNTNLGARIIFNDNPWADVSHPRYTATVYDDVGNASSFFWKDGIGFIPDLRSNYSNLSLRGTLSLTVENNSPVFTFTGRFGTTLRYTYAANYFRSGPSGTGTTEAYYRLDRAIDRNGNELRYEYGTPDPTLVTAIYDPILYDPSLYNSKENSDSNPQEHRRRIRFRYVNIYGGMRVASAEDPLGRVFQYRYIGDDPNETIDDSNRIFVGQLRSVVKPPVRDVNAAVNAPLVYPEIRFEYYHNQLRREIFRTDGDNITTLDWDSRGSITWISPKTIEDARWVATGGAEGNRTSFNFEFHRVPMSLQKQDGIYYVLSEDRPELTSVTTSDGTVYLSGEGRNLTGMTSHITDTSGHVTNYHFGGTVATAPNDLGFAFVITQLTRSAQVTNADGHTSTKTVTFQYSGDVNSNLTSVEDMSGNTVKYEYQSGEPGDDFDTNTIYGSAYGTYYAVFGQPSKSVLDEAGANMHTQYRYDLKFNKLLKQINADGRTTVYELDEFGNRIAATDGIYTHYVFGENGQITHVYEDVTPVTATTIYHYDGNGFLTETIDADGRRTTYTPNAFGNLEYTTIHHKEGEDLTPLDGNATLDITTRRVADIMDRTIDEYDAMGQKTHYDYDNWDRVIQTTLPPVLRANADPFSTTPVEDEGVTSSQYDFNSNVIQETDANGHVTLREYDRFNRPTVVRKRMSANSSDDIVTEASYDNRGLLASETDANNNTTTHQYDDLLRPIITTSPPVHIATSASSADPDALKVVQYVSKTYYGKNSGSGAFTLGGFNPTRVVTGIVKEGDSLTGGHAADTVYDGAYRAIKTIARHADVRDGDDLAHDADPRPGEPTTITEYNKVQKPVRVTVLNTDRNGVGSNRYTHTYYDAQGRPTVTVIDLDGDGTDVANPSLPHQNSDIVNDAFSFVGDPDDIITRTKYDLTGNVTDVEDANGNLTHTVYDSAQRAVRVDLPPVRVYRPGTGWVDNVVTHTSTTYDANSRPVITTDARDTQTFTKYDKRGRVLYTILDLDGDTVFGGANDIVHWTGYDQVGNAIYSIDPNGNRTDTHYDAANRAYEVVAPQITDYLGVQSRPTTRSIYDKNGNVTHVTDPLGIVTHTEYDELNRARFVTQNATHGNDLDWITSETRYDERNNVVAQVLYNREHVLYDRNMDTVYDYKDDLPLPQITTYEYDDFGRRTRETLPGSNGSDPGITVTAYNLAGEAITVTDPKSQVIETDYDRAGRVHEMRFKHSAGAMATEMRTSTYDKNGNLLRRTDNEGDSYTAYTFDALNRQLSEERHTEIDNQYGTVDDDYTVISGYDDAGNRTLVTYPNTGRTLVSEYDRAGRMVQLNDGTITAGVFAPSATIGATTFGYDAAGNRIRHTSPYGVVTIGDFDALNHVTSLVSRGEDGQAADPLYAISYEYDLSGNRRTAHESLGIDQTRDLVWTYDHLYRLTEERWTGDAGTIPQIRRYAYDPAGNRLKQTIDTTPGSDGDEHVTTYEYDVRNRLITSEFEDLSGTLNEIYTTYGYDLNGNRTEKNVNGEIGRSYNYTYDIANRLVKANNNVANEHFVAWYNARTRRVAKTEDNTQTLFRYDGGTNFQELKYENTVGVSVVAELVRAGGLGGGIGSVLYSDKTMDPETPGEWEGFLYNAVGSTVIVADSAGTPTQRNLYEAFGETITQDGDSANNRLRNTKERDSSINLDNDGFRYYDPETATYIQRDPTGYADGMNVYMSVHANPVNGVDPEGLSVKPSSVGNSYTWDSLALPEAKTASPKAWSAAASVGTTSQRPATSYMSASAPLTVAQISDGQNQMTAWFSDSAYARDRANEALARSRTVSAYPGTAVGGLGLMWDCFRDVAPDVAIATAAVNGRIGQAVTQGMVRRNSGSGNAALGNVNAQPGQSPSGDQRRIQPNEVTTFQDFVDRSQVGDKLDGHELWQHANLNEGGFAEARLSTETSKQNPVIALPNAIHQQLTQGQSQWDARSQTPTENINTNATLMRLLDAAPEANISDLQSKSLQHAENSGRGR